MGHVAKVLFVTRIPCVRHRHARLCHQSLLGDAEMVWDILVLSLSNRML
jgi:hypothetical protein